jgi:hypothetical protein
METYKRKFKFYCPQCKNEEIREFDIDINSLNGYPQDFILNMRDFYGRPLYHYPCSKCQSLTNATMVEYWCGENNITNTEQNKNLEWYIKDTIDMYGLEDYGDKWRAFLKQQWENKMKNSRSYN